MKEKSLLRKIMMAVVCLWTWSVNATTVSVVYNSSSGISYARYTAALVDGTVLGFYIEGSNVYFRGAITTATSLVVPDSILTENGEQYPVEYVGYYYGYEEYCCDFSQSPNLTNIELPSVKFVMRYAFYSCSNLAEISLPTATSIGYYAFQNCSSLASISLPSLETVESSMFQGLTSLTNIDITSATTIGSYAFQNCSSLTSISMPSATSLSYCVFYNCSSLSSISLPASASISSDTFYRLNSLVDLYLLGDSIATWDLSWLPSNTNVIWVAKENYNAYKNWISNGFEVRYVGWTPTTITVSENIAGQMAQKILEQVGQWTDVEALVVTGHLNESDMNYLSQLTCVRQIDLSGTDITSIKGCTGLKMLHKITLPPTLTAVGDNAFNGCVKLDSLSLPNVKTIGDNAFSDCHALSNIEMPLVEKVGYRGFYYCLALTDLSLPLMKSADMQAFEGCTGLTNIELPSLNTVGDRAFSYCMNLERASLPVATSLGFRVFLEDRLLKSVALPVATSIGGYAFSKCRSLTAIEMPIVESIGTQAFESCDSLTSITLPESICFIGSSCFRYCGKLTDIYCYAPLPFTTAAFTSTTSLSNATLHVPTFGLMAYQMNVDWNMFSSIVPINEDIRTVNVSTDVSINSTAGLAEKSEWLLGYANNQNIPGHLTVDAPSILSMGRFEQDINMTQGNNLTTLIAHSEITADSVIVKMTVPIGSWQFISLPFDANVSDIQVSDGALWVIRRYSGADRAAQTGNTWQNMTTESVLQAGEGYILQCVREDGTSDDVSFVFNAIDNSKKNNLFARDNVDKALNLYESEFAYNNSWNLIGNPYPSYYAINNIIHNGIITVWNGNGYTAYSPTDDQYVAKPFEAFFVQRADDAEVMTFKGNGRQHTPNADNSAPSPAMNRAPQSRCVYNLTLSDDNYTDRTRLVVNPEAKFEYETSCDAAKIMSMNTHVPQLYIIDNGVSYAIDERPVGNGVLQLGIRIGVSGSYAIALQNTSSEDSIILTDNRTGTKVDLASDIYYFNTEVGIDESRFSITVGGDITAITTTKTTIGNEGKWVTIDGKHAKDCTKPGLYIVNQNGKNCKVVITK